MLMETNIKKQIDEFFEAYKAKIYKALAEEF